MISAPDGLPSGTAARAGSVRGVAASVGLLRTGVLVPVGSGDGRWLRTASTQGVSGSGRDLAAVQDLDVRKGRLDALGPGRVAVDALLAKAAHARIGQRLALHLPDGTRISPTVVAIYGRGLGIAELTLPRTALAGHVTSSFDSDVLVRDAEGADRKAVAAASAGSVSRSPTGTATRRPRTRTGS
ncbi:MacB-like periplasmic core domain-containing protein OS=Streptomyces antimycoticus OX=68175 GN=SANT12839_036120 PE=4 SV=1 [Streptomyces antimycoticus]